MNQKSFTVIELLVVIALIALLASIVLVSFNLPEKRYRANVAKSLQFSQSIQNAIGIDAAGWWNFDDDIADGKVTDTSGNGNTGTLCDSTGCNGVGPTQTDDTPHKVAGTGGGKSALSFNGGDDYVQASDSASLDINGEITVEAWVYWKSTPSYQAAISAKGGGWGRTGWLLTISENSKFRWHLGNGSTEVWIESSSLAKNTWYHVATLLRGTTMEIYLNGVKQPTTGTWDHVYTNNNPHLIGRTDGGFSFWFNGLIDEVRIYSQALTAQQIQQHYVEGLKRHQDLVQK